MTKELNNIKILVAFATCIIVKLNLLLTLLGLNLLLNQAYVIVLFLQVSLRAIGFHSYIFQILLERSIADTLFVVSLQNIIFMLEILHF